MGGENVGSADVLLSARCVRFCIYGVDARCYAIAPTSIDFEHGAGMDGMLQEIIGTKSWTMMYMEYIKSDKERDSCCTVGSPAPIGRPCGGVATRREEAKKDAE